MERGFIPSIINCIFSSYFQSCASICCSSCCAGMPTCFRALMRLDGFVIAGSINISGFAAGHLKRVRAYSCPVTPLPPGNLRVHVCLPHLTLLSSSEHREDADHFIYAI